MRSSSSSCSSSRNGSSQRNAGGAASLAFMETSEDVCARPFSRSRPGLRRSWHRLDRAEVKAERALALVVEVVVQRVAYGGERDVVPRHVVLVAQPDLQRL